MTTPTPEACFRITRVDLPSFPKHIPLTPQTTVTRRASEICIVFNGEHDFRR